MRKRGLTAYCSSFNKSVERLSQRVLCGLPQHIKLNSVDCVQTIFNEYIASGSKRFFVHTSILIQSNLSISNSVNSKSPLFRTKIECPWIYPSPLRFPGYFEAPLFRTFFISLGTSKQRGSTVLCLVLLFFLLFLKYFPKFSFPTLRNPLSCFPLTHLHTYLQTVN